MPARILIVEDEEPLTLLLRYNLEAEGFEVDSVARGDDAELHLRDHTCRTCPARLDAAGASPASSSAGGCARAATPSACRSSC
jgi:DNA-binding NtrC family response regulator